jgi:hypothetical protein
MVLSQHHLTVKPSIGRCWGPRDINIDPQVSFYVAVDRSQAIGIGALVDHPVYFVAGEGIVGHRVAPMDGDHVPSRSHRQLGQTPTFGVIEVVPQLREDYQVEMAGRPV